MALIEKLNAIGDAIRAKNGEEGKYTLDDMVLAIGAIETGGGGAELTDDFFLVTGNCSYKFSGDQWKYFFENEPFKSKWKSEKISDAQYMFYKNYASTIPFVVNTRNDISGGIDAKYMFYECVELKQLPELGKVFEPKDISYLLCSCKKIREIPNSWVDNIDFSLINNSTSTNLNNVTYGLNSIRSFPAELLKKMHGASTQSLGSTSSLYSYLFYEAFSIDEVVGVPVYGTATSNRLTYFCSKCHRAKEIIFDTNEDGTAKTAKWKQQTIDLSSSIGYTGAAYTSNVTGNNSGITSADLIKSDTYNTVEEAVAAMQSNPNWFTSDFALSRYNKFSAINTINSLPDTSEYLASSGGTNTIKFKSRAGEGYSIDGVTAEIGKMTPEEIAVATAKGWTVSLV